MELEMRNTIIEKATESLRLYGVKGTSMDSVAASVCVSKRTLYELFFSKADLVNDCVGYLLRRVESDIKSMSTEQPMRALVDINCYLKELCNSFCPTLWRDVKRSSSIVTEIESFYNCSVKVLLGELLERLVAQGEVDSRSDLQLFVGFLTQHLRTSVVEATDADLFRYNIITHLAGICTDSGRKELKKIQ